MTAQIQYYYIHTRRASTRYSILCSVYSKAVPKSIVYTSRYEWKYISRFLKRFWVMNGSLRSYFVWSRNAFNLDNASVSIAITTRFWMGKKIVLNSHQFQSSYFTLYYTYTSTYNIFLRSEQSVLLALEHSIKPFIIIFQ